MRRTALLTGRRDQSVSSAIDAVGVFLAVVILVVAYFLPFLIACWRRHQYRWLVFLINVFAASGIGWIAAMVLALWTPRQQGHVRHGRPSGQSAQRLPGGWRTNQRRPELGDPGISTELQPDVDL
jgi:Superinfection immunity protein